MGGGEGSVGGREWLGGWVGVGRVGFFEIHIIGSPVSSQMPRTSLANDARRPAKVSDEAEARLTRK